MSDNGPFGYDSTSHLTRRSSFCQPATPSPTSLVSTAAHAVLVCDEIRSVAEGRRRKPWARGWDRRIGAARSRQNQ